VGIGWGSGFSSDRYDLYLIEIAINAGLAQWQCSGFVIDCGRPNIVPSRNVLVFLSFPDPETFFVPLRSSPCYRVR
jgi:hypothetical protein